MVYHDFSFLFIRQKMTSREKVKVCSRFEEYFGDDGDPVESQLMGKLYRLPSLSTHAQSKCTLKRRAHIRRKKKKMSLECSPSASVTFQDENHYAQTV